MTKEKLTQTLQDLSTQAIKAFNSEQYHPFMLFIFGKTKHNKDTTIISVIPNTEQRHEILYKLGLSIGKNNTITEENDLKSIPITSASNHPNIQKVEAIAILGETWYSEINKEEKTYIRPSEDPNKKEALLIAGMTSEKITETKLLKIKTNPNNTKIIDQSEDEILKSNKPESINTPLLNNFWEGLKEGQNILTNQNNSLIFKPIKNLIP